MKQKSAESGTENIILSPYSVSNALKLLAQAANGVSYDELKQGLSLTDEKELNVDMYGAFNYLLQQNAGNATLLLANQIYVQQGYELKKEFKEIATEKFSSGVESLDFSKSEEAAKVINKFVEEKTNQKIKDLVTPDALSATFRVVVANAIYMKAQWQTKFQVFNTYKEDFLSNGVDKFSVDFMHATKNFNYGVAPELDATVLELKYFDSNLALVMILPNSNTGLTALENKLKDFDLQNISKKLSDILVKVSIPKFKVEYETSMAKTLKEV